jgi:hypothetical protein
MAYEIRDMIGEGPQYEGPGTAADVGEPPEALRDRTSQGGNFNIRGPATSVTEPPGLIQPPAPPPPPVWTQIGESPVVSVDPPPGA